MEVCKLENYYNKENNSNTTQFNKLDQFISPYQNINKLLDSLNIGYAILNQNLYLVNSNNTIQDLSRECAVSEEIYMDDFPEKSDLDNNYKTNDDTKSEFDKKWSNIIYSENKVQNFIGNVLSNLIEVSEFFKEDNLFRKKETSLDLENINKRKLIDLSEFIEYFCSKIMSTNEYNNFDYITVGISKLSYREDDINENIKYFEIKIKFSKCELNKNNICEFILNDISKLKEIEMIKAKIMYKNMGLAKVAHDFKNPVESLVKMLKEFDNNNLHELNNSNNNSNYSSSESSKSDSNHIFGEQTHNNKRHFRKEEKSKTSKENKSKFYIKEIHNHNNSHKNNQKNLIINLCNYLQILINDFNSYAKLDIEKINLKNEKIILKEVQIYPILDFCLNLFKFKNEKKEVELKLSIDKEVPEYILANESKLKQVIVNLLSNALKFTIQGEIVLSVEISGYDTNKRKIVRISVRDSGIGMTEEEQQTLFSPFKMLDNGRHLNPNGSGLGLMIIKETLNQMGCQINLESERNKGTVFWFDIIEYEGNLIENLTKSNFNSNNLNANLNSYIESDEFSSYIDQNLCYTESLIGIINNLNNDSNSSIIQDLIDKRKTDNDNKNIILESKNEEENTILNETILLEENEKFPYLNKMISEQDINRVNKILKRVSNKTLFVGSKNGSKKNINQSNKRIRILICDDEPLITQTMTRNIKKVFLENLIENEIIVFHNGMEVLCQILQDNQNKTFHDILIIDESMPFFKGSNVVKILKILIDENQLKPILIYMASGYEDPCIKESFIKVGCTGVLTKPVSIEDLSRMFMLHKLI